MANKESDENYAQELIDSISLNTDSRANNLFSKPDTTFCPAPDNQKGLFVQDQEVLARQSWSMLIEMQGGKKYE